jgi:hypothetical protein
LACFSNELAVAQRLGRRQPAVGGAQHALEQLVAGLVERDLALQQPDTSTSMCSLMVRTVRGLAQILMTGRIGLPITLPWPVGKKCTT